MFVAGRKGKCFIHKISLQTWPKATPCTVQFDARVYREYRLQWSAAWKSATICQPDARYLLFIHSSINGSIYAAPRPASGRANAATTMHLNREPKFDRRREHSQKSNSARKVEAGKSIDLSRTAECSLTCHRESGERAKYSNYVLTISLPDARQRGASWCIYVLSLLATCCTIELCGNEQTVSWPLAVIRIV